MDESVSLLAVRLLPEIDKQGGRGLIAIMDGDQKAEAMARLLAQLAPERRIFHFPAWDCLPYDRAAPSPDLMGQRMRVLVELTAHPESVVISTAEAALQRVPPLSGLPAPVVLKVGTAFDPAAMARQCLARGYSHADRVDDPGQFAIRGEVFDIYPAMPRPYRLAFSDGHVTAIHRYDPQTQRSTSEVSAIRIDPVSEVVLDEVDAATRFDGIEHWWPEFYPTAETLFDALPQAAVVLDLRTEQRATRHLDSIAEAYRDRIAADRVEVPPPRHALPPHRLYLTADEWASVVKRRSRAVPPCDNAEEPPRFCLVDKPGFAFAAFAKAQIAAGLDVVLGGMRDRDLAILAKQAERATGIAPRRLAGWSEVASLGRGTIGLMRLGADHGFVDLAARVALVTAADLLGHHARALASRAVPVPWHLGDGDFATGDLVIHLDHGVGQLKGLESVAGPDAGAYDAIRLGFADAADLLVPVEGLDRIWRYGGQAEDVALDKLGGHAWAKRQAKLAKDIAATARGLVAMARRRQGLKAPKIVPPRRGYEQFVAGFPYAPTVDQMHAIDDCLRDLARSTPMDRLVVGDVGFGKTEVALRAAAAAVLAGHQVAVIAPTTVLARQHVQCFARRFADLDVTVAQLSRLTAPAEAEQVRAGLRDGTIRLVVGTQALCGAEVAFQNLGLLVIDEEQRFGKADKDRVRALSNGAHVLTLTATPIPRTLQSALVGLQDLSMITTPPARRRPIRTLLAPFDTAALRTALLEEKRRGGQSFVVVPRIEDMDGLATTLRQLVPELTLRMAHGQMELGDIDQAMADFAGGNGDVLLATSIIESGLDVPRANTMVICRADRFGLAELHQLRGRVGRGRQQGVCYLMTAPDHALAPTAERRLATLARLDRLGSGMAISAQDLDARGSGDLTGEEQAGHTHLIGLGLYQHLLQQALREAGTEATEDWVPELHLGEGGSFPPDYIPEPDVRINLYARLARATDAHDVDLLAEETEDRFGPVPPEVRSLLARARLKCLCRSHSIARIDAGPKAIAFTPRDGMTPEGLLAEASPRDRAAAKVKDGRLLFSPGRATAGEERMALTARFLQAIG